uniref:ABC transporter n=1 Tax=Candidatus Kentrum eta TaxID=2126337 RepID=A0A450V4L7_9GAMM|nr:MAG: ABC transporter [Candidatus Kentron sp. H]VFJ92882.1 MAG: ABC transporter [Candidatus Kentron sp. H]VFJ99718.1 MAG: ABC transporter [Candidatus Kentron sp. H]
MISHFCVLVGVNGTGKSTLFKAFEFLKESLSGNIYTALARLGENHCFSIDSHARGHG